MITSAAILLISGCQSGEPVRQNVGGKVTVEGIESVNGAISFLPTAGHSGPAASTKVVNGKYAFTSANGPLPGAYRVTLTLEKTAREVDPIQEPAMTGKADLMKEESKSGDSSNPRSSVTYQAQAEIGDGDESSRDFRFPIR